MTQCNPFMSSTVDAPSADSLNRFSLPDPAGHFGPYGGVYVPETLMTALELAGVPDMIRGFGPVKDANRVKAEAQRRALLAKLAAPAVAPVAMAAE